MFERLKTWLFKSHVWKKVRFYFVNYVHNFSYHIRDENIIIDHKSQPTTSITSKPVVDPPVRLISFYLPQFHAIPENDKWWGKGFTEWTNVKKAKAVFKGHYQPRIPGELGYYDLADKDVQRRQIELAKLYGISGFSFYFYWFGSKRLLETPLLNLLNDRTLDIPFCLTWANENWTRRWDGKEKEILIEQCYSAEDDIRFIEYISRYLCDPRYIRINGKPLIIVYRPRLLPSAKKTAERWRRWCRDHGIGEIYLAYTQSFESVDPKKYGFDAAIEFPPNNSRAPDITSKVKQLDPEYIGSIYDWNIFPVRSNSYKRVNYKLFRGVNVSWDNTARLKLASTIFINDSPKRFRVWLENAIEDTIMHSRNKEEQIVFINAWNEWSEGAYLEPDQKYGYAYLQATKDALLNKY